MLARARARQKRAPADHQNHPIIVDAALVTSFKWRYSLNVSLFSSITYFFFYQRIETTALCVLNDNDNQMNRGGLKGDI